MGLQGVQVSLPELSATESSVLASAALFLARPLGACLRAAREMRDFGTFAFAEEVVSYRDISAMLPS